MAAVYIPDVEPESKTNTLVEMVMNNKIICILSLFNECKPWHNHYIGSDGKINILGLCFVKQVAISRHLRCRETRVNTQK